MSDQEPGFPDFKSLRETPKASDGKQTPESLARFIDAAVYRSLDGQVRGLKLAYSKSDGTFTTAQGDEFSVKENGEPGNIKITAPVEKHEAIPIPTETITFQDGTTIEVSLQPVGQLFNGDPQPGYPHFIGGSSSIEAGVVIPALTTKTTSSFETVAGVGRGQSVSTTSLELHSPFIEPPPKKTFEQSLEEMRQNFIRGTPIPETPDPTLVKSVTPQEYRQDASLRLITKITPNSSKN